MSDGLEYPLTSRVLKSRRVPIQVKKRSYGSGLLCSSPTNSEITRAIEATAMAARDAGSRAETRRSRRSSRADTASPMPPPASPLSRKTSERKSSEQRPAGDSPKSSSVKAVESDLDVIARHERELSSLRADHAVAERAMVARHEAELQAAKSMKKRRKLTIE